MRASSDLKPLQAPQLPQLFPRLARAARLAYGAVGALAVLTLWSSILDAPRLRDFGAGFAPMPPAASLAFLLLACSFFSASGENRRQRRASFAAAAAAALIALLSLVEYAAGTGLGMNFAFVTAWRGIAPAGIAPAPAFALLLLAVATPLLGFSLPGAFATLCAAFALAAGRPSPWLIETLSGRGTGAVVTRWLLPAAFGVPLAIGWMRLLAEREGLFSEAFGMALFTVVMIAAFSALVLWVARTLDLSAARRAEAEEQAGQQGEL